MNEQTRDLIGYGANPPNPRWPDNRISGHPARANAIIRFLEYVLAHDRVWICRREDIVNHWQKYFACSGS